MPVLKVEIEVVADKMICLMSSKKLWQSFHLVLQALSRTQILGERRAAAEGGGRTKVFFLFWAFIKGDLRWGVLFWSVLFPYR